MPPPHRVGCDKHAFAIITTLFFSIFVTIHGCGGTEVCLDKQSRSSIHTSMIYHNPFAIKGSFWWYDSDAGSQAGFCSAIQNSAKKPKMMLYMRHTQLYMLTHRAAIQLAYLSYHEISVYYADESLRVFWSWKGSYIAAVCWSGQTLACKHLRQETRGTLLCLESFHIHIYGHWMIQSTQHHTVCCVHIELPLHTTLRIILSTHSCFE